MCKLVLKHSFIQSDLVEDDSTSASVVNYDAMMNSYIVPVTGTYLFKFVSIDLEIGKGRIIGLDDYIALTPTINDASFTITTDRCFIINDISGLPSIGNNSIILQLNKNDLIEFKYSIQGEISTNEIFFEAENAVVELYTFIDSDLILPKYQSITEAINDNCRVCEKVFYDVEKDLQFQLVSRFFQELDSNLIQNPFFDAGFTSYSSDGTMDRTTTSGATISPTPVVEGTFWQDIAMVADQLYFNSYNYAIKNALDTIGQIKLEVIRISDSLVAYENILNTIGLPRGTDEEFEGNRDLFTIPSTGNYRIKFTLTSEDATPLPLNSAVIDDIIVSPYYNIPTEIDSITLTDCDGTVTELDSSIIDDIEYNVDYDNIIGNLLVTIPSSNFSVGAYSLTINYDGGTIQSNILNFFDTSSCVHNKRLIPFRWSDKCLFGCIDYSLFYFENEVYLNAYFEMQDNDIIERITSLQPDGRSKLIYNHSVEKALLRVGLQPSFIHSNFARIFEHGNFYIDNNKYYIDRGSSYNVTSIKNGGYLAQIELIKDGSEVIKTSCC